MKTLTLMLCIALAPVMLPAALTVHLTLTANGELVEGDSSETTLERENTIECLSFTQEMFQPRDAASGLPTGKRQHGPVTVTKRIDKSSPILARAMTQNEAITGVFRFYRPNNEGAIEHYYTVEIAGAISALRTITPDVLSPETATRPDMEEMSLVPHTITWTYEFTGASHTVYLLDPRAAPPAE